MKATVKLILGMALLAATVSCNMNTEEILFQETAMGFVQKDYTFLSDSGITYDFNIGEGKMTYYEPGNRLFITCNAKTKTADKRYVGTLLSLVKPIYKDALVKSQVTDWTVVGHDNIYLENAWYSGGCLNIIAKICYNPYSETVHTMNLVLEDTASSGTVIFDLRHNANGDTSEDDSASVCLSFPIAGYLPESAKEITVGIKTIWDGEEETKHMTITQ